MVPSVPVAVSALSGFLAGVLCGILTGLLHTALGIPSILAGILTQLMLYSINLTILGGKSLMTIDPRLNQLLVNMSDNPKAIMVMIAIVYGNRLIMMHEGEILIDVKGEEKQNLTIEQLLKLFEANSGSQFGDDKAILSK